MTLSLLWFFTVVWGLGFTLAKLVNESNDLLERNIIRLGIGFGFFALLAALLNLIGIPLTWWTFLISSLAAPIIFAVKRFANKPKKHGSLNIINNKQKIYGLLAVTLALILLAVYLKGAFTYPYLEDDDSWGYATSAKYVSIHKSFSVEPELLTYARTLQPYPPIYSTLIGVAHQLTDSISWTLKVFNSLFIALGIVFFYFFTKEFLQSKNKALAATFILTVIPSYLSHFIWATSLAVSLFFPFFYCLERAKKKEKWWIPAAFIGAAVLLISHSSGAVLIALYILYLIGNLIASYFKHEKILSRINIRLLLSGMCALILSCIYWIPTLIKYGGVKATLTAFDIFGKGLFTEGVKDTSGGIVYGIKDFIVAPLVTKMDQPTGLGIFIFSLAVLALILLIYNYKKTKTKSFFIITLFWLFFTLLGVEGNALPVKFLPHRFWAYFAIPISILAAEGIIIILDLFKKRKLLKYGALLFLLIGILITSAYPKYFVETSRWPPGVSWSSKEELIGYISLKKLPKNTMILPLCSPDFKVIGFDQMSPGWDQETIVFKKNILKKSPEEIKEFIIEKKYKYFILDATCIKKYGKKETEEFMEKMKNSGLFKVIGRNKGFILAGLNNDA